MKRVFKLTAILGFVCLFSTNLLAQTNISGNIEGDSTVVWTAAGSPYIIQATTTITAGDTVVVENGAEVRFDSGQNLIVTGALIADGATFTSNTTSTRSAWNRIYFNTSDSYGDFNNCLIQYGDQSIYAASGTVNVDSTTISDSNDALFVHSAAVSGQSLPVVNISNSIITTSEDPVRYASIGTVNYSGANDFTGNDKDAIYLDFSSTSADFILENAPVPYRSSTFSVNSPAKLTVKTGAIWKFFANAQLRINDGGAIEAIADSGETILFTSIKNDNAFGDTNNDGTLSAPAKNDWNGIVVNGSTRDADNILRRIEVSFAGDLNNTNPVGGLNLTNSNATVDSSLYVNNIYGVVLRNSDAKFSNNEMGSSQVVPLILTFDSEPVFTNNSFSSSNNQYDAIGLLGTTITSNSTLQQRDFTSIPNVTYLLLNRLTVDTGVTLNIEPGVVVKALPNSGIVVRGTLISDANPDSITVFTAVTDDNVGNPNDTNKDGNTTVPTDAAWRGFGFGEDSDASIIDYNIIRYARYNTSYPYNSAANLFVSPRGAINMINSDMTVSNSEIVNSDTYGIDARGTSKPTISNNSFSNTGSVPVALSLSADPTFSGNSVANVGLTAIGYHGEVISAPSIIRNRDFAGFTGITTVLLGNSTITSGSTLTIEPGTVLKVVNVSTGTILGIEGTLVADGSETEKIVITSIFDDQVGNPLDTNGDGGSTTPSPNNWGTIRFFPTADDVGSIVDNTEIRYSRHGMVFSDAAPTVDSVTVLSCRYVGFVAESGSNVTISNSTIQNCGEDPLGVSTTSTPTYNNITFNSNGSNGIILLEASSARFSSSYNQSFRYMDTRGNIGTNVTLVPYTVAGFTNIPFILRTNPTVTSNTTFSVAPGIVFKGNVLFLIDGAIRTLGTETNPVTFTSFNDDGSGGDTNNDGNTTIPSPGQSSRIVFRSSGIDSLNLINNTIFRYPTTALEFNSADAVVDSSLFALSLSTAIWIKGNSSPVIQNNTFENISSSVGQIGNSILMDMFSTPTFSNNSESNVRIRGIGINGQTWGSDATIPVRSFAGVDSTTYVLYGNITIPSGTSITIPEGVVFKSYTRFGSTRSKYGFTVDGSLSIDGTASNPVVFTLDTDDNYGNPADLYNDGPGNDTFKSGNWFTFNATSIDTANIIRNAVIKGANNAINLASASPTIDSTLFEQNNYGIRLGGVSAPVVTNNTFNDLRFTPLLISLVSYPDSTSGNVMSGTTYPAIGVLNETLVQDATLAYRTFAGRTGIPYYFTGTYTIGTNSTLTVDPGVISKFTFAVQLVVNRGLIADGGSTPDSAIVFTSIEDDFYGGDTNRNSTATSVVRNQWTGIRYTGTAIDNISILDNVIVRGSTYGVIADNASPTITNSSLNTNTYGVRVYGSGNPVINNSDIYNNFTFGIENRDKTFTINAENNWWGDDSGPTHSGNPSGTGDEVTDGVDYTPFQGSGTTNPALGDVSLNGNVQSFDASLILQDVATLITFSALQESVADVTGDGSVSALDASEVLQYVVGIRDAFSAELNAKVRLAALAKLNVEDIVLRIGESSVEDDQLILPLEFENVHDLLAFEIKLASTMQGLELESVERAEVLNGATFVSNVTEENEVILALASTTAIEESGALLNLRFNILDENFDSRFDIKTFIANELDLTATSVGEEEDAVIPTEYDLSQNYPNPFNPSTNISFSIPEAGFVQLDVFNLLGQRVATLVSENRQAGIHTVNFDAQRLSSGIYIYRIQSGDFVSTKKMMLIK